MPSICASLAELPRLARVPFTSEAGSVACGGEHLEPGPQPPHSGRLDDATGNKVADLGLGCLYTGHLTGVRLPDGAASVLDVVGINGLNLILAGSSGDGPANCTKGAGPERVCANGNAGTDGNGACAEHADCGSAANVCLAKPNCTFGPPVPITGGIAPVCIVNAFESDMCGNVDVLAQTTNLTTVLQSRIYFPEMAEKPCPTCVGNVCIGGKNNGQACTTTSTMQTSVDCPPYDTGYFTSLRVELGEITSGTATLGTTDPLPCPGQSVPGMLGVSNATRVTQVGAFAPGGQTILAATFCVRATGNFLIDSVARLPSAGAMSVAGTMDLSQVLPLP